MGNDQFEPGFNEKIHLWGLSDEDVKGIDKYDGFMDCFEDFVKVYVQKNNLSNMYNTVIDHTPLHIKNMSNLFAVIEDIYVVNVIRDCRAVVSSVIDLDWGPNTIVDATKWWMEYIAFGLALEKKYPQKCISVKYEDIVLNPRNELKKISSFVNISYREEMLMGRGFIVPEYTKNQHGRVGCKPDISRILKWEHELNDNQKVLIQHYTRDILNYLGYQGFNVNLNVNKWSLNFYRLQDSLRKLNFPYRLLKFYFRRKKI